MFWAGWDDEETNGVFVNANTKETLRNINGVWQFFPGEPNGGTKENCVVVWPARNGWNDQGCDIGAYGFCHMDPRPRLVLRGNETLLSIKLHNISSCVF